MRCVPSPAAGARRATYDLDPRRSCLLAWFCRQQRLYAALCASLELEQRERTVAIRLFVEDAMAPAGVRNSRPCPLQADARAARSGFPAARFDVAITAGARTPEGIQTSPLGVRK